MNQAEVLNVVLSHQPSQAVNRVLHWWRAIASPEAILVVHTGEASEFAKIDHGQKIHASDSRVATRDHQREMQSYTELFAAVSRFCAKCAFRYIHFTEYDHLPLVSDLNARQIEKSERESADVLGFHLQRIDGTSHPHYLYHVSNPGFHACWRAITVRTQPEVVLSMFGSGSFWRREAFDAVARRAEPFPMYLEIYLPTLAHHLGFRLHDYGEQNRFVHNLGERNSTIERARAEGAWTLHPVKELGDL